MTQTYPFVVNLIPKRRIRRRAAIVAVRRWSIAILVTALAVALPANALALHQRAAAIPAKSSVVSVTSELDTVRSAIPDLKARQSELDRQHAEQRLAESRVDWHSFLTLLAPHIPDNAHLETFTASIQREETMDAILINTRIRTRSLSEARDALVTLENTGLFASVEMMESRQVQTGPDVAVLSSIRARIEAPHKQTKPDPKDTNG